MRSLSRWLPSAKLMLTLPHASTGKERLKTEIRSTSSTISSSQATLKTVSRAKTAAPTAGTATLPERRQPFRAITHKLCKSKCSTPSLTRLTSKSLIQTRCKCNKCKIMKPTITKNYRTSRNKCRSKCNKCDNSYLTNCPTKQQPSKTIKPHKARTKIWKTNSTSTISRTS